MQKKSTTVVLVIGALILAALAATALAIRFKVSADKALETSQLASMELDSLRRQQRSRLSTASRPAVLSPQVTETLRTDTEAQDALQTRIQELEVALREKEDLIASLQQQATNAPARPPWSRGRRQRLEELKQTDPEQYQEVMQQQEAARVRVRASLARKAARVLERDTTAMGEEELEEYNLMVTLLEETWTLAEQLRGDLPRDERRTIRRSMAEKMFTLTPMLEAERDREFYDLGMEFGYTEEESREFVTYLNEVIDLTSMRDVWRGMRPTRGDSPPRRTGTNP